LEVQMKKPPNYELQAFIPGNPSACKTIQDMFMDNETSDVVFEVGGKQKTDESGTKNIKTESKTFYAHHVILKKCAPVLADMRNSGAPTDPIQLLDVSPETFNYLLEYIYGHESADFVFGTDMVQVKEVMEAADKYGVAYLKLKAEACYVASIEITLDNVMEHLHYADSMNCALLKEVVVDFIANWREVIIERKILKDVPGGLINDILAATIRVENARNGDYVDLHAISINEIRRRAHEKGLVVDGSREMLISSLEHLESNSTNS
jgi:BTB/POZ domain